MAKRIKGTAVLLSICLLSVCGCTDETASEPELSYPALRIALPVLPDVKQSDIDEAESKVNEILRENLKAEINFETWDFDDYNEQMKKNLAKENNYDILFATNESFNENWLSGTYLEISDLLKEYGQGIIETVGWDIIEQMYIEDGLYAISDVRDYAVTLDTVYVEQNLLDQYGIDPDSIENEEDLEKCFEEISAADPDKLIVSAVSYFGNHTPFAFLMPLGVLDESGREYINYFETEEYLNHLRRLHRWYQKGWIRAEIKGDRVFLDSEQPFALYRYGKPGGDIETSAAYDVQYIGILDGQDVLPQGVYYLSSYAVSSSAEDPGLAMKILNQFYTDAQINEALAKIMYLWTLPNLFLTQVPSGYPEDLWQQQKAFNENAVVLPDTGFNFNPRPVMKEYLESSEIYRRYRQILETGIADPETTLSRMNSELEEAGLSEVIAEKNRQYQIWLNR